MTKSDDIYPATLKAEFDSYIETLTQVVKDLTSSEVTVSDSDSGKTMTATASSILIDLEAAQTSDKLTSEVICVLSERYVNFMNEYSEALHLSESK